MSQLLEKKLAVRGLASGQAATITVWRALGTTSNNAGSGIGAYLQSGIHGAELQGHAVILLLAEFFAQNPPMRDVVLVPFCNPVGGDNRSGEFTQGRFDPNTGDNWNRLYCNVTASLGASLNNFSERELRGAILTHLDRHLAAPLGFGQRLAATLQRLAAEADTVLDLHCASRSALHAYTPEYAEQVAAHLGFPFVISIPNEFGGALDEAIFQPWWTWAGAQRKAPVIALTLELGHHESVDFPIARAAAIQILRLLALRGVVAEQDVQKFAKQASEFSGRSGFFSSEAPDAPAHAFVDPSAVRVGSLADYKTVYAPAGGLLEWLREPGTLIKSGELVARIHRLGSADGPREIIECLATSTGALTVLHSSGQVQEGMELFKILGGLRQPR